MPFPITMGKRRNAGKKSDGGAASSINDGGGRSSNNIFSVFEFTSDDLLAEDKSAKICTKFGAKSPSSKPVRRRKSVDKYDFLKCFAQGTKSKQKDFGNDELEAAATVSQDKTFGTDVEMSLGSLDYESVSLSSLECQSSECTYGVKSGLGRWRKPGCHTAGKKHTQVWYLDTDDDERLELGSLGSSIKMGENEGSLKGQSSENGANSNDCEAVVVVTPYYVKHEKNYFGRCFLTFSRRCIRLEGSPVCDRKSTLCVEWPTSDILNIEHQQCETDKAEVINIHLRYKEANADETGNSTLGSVELEFVILDDPQWSEKQEEIKSLDLKYETSWKTSVIECYLEESFEEVVYPDGDPYAVIISRRDIELLQPRTFINDTIIDFYIRYLLNKIKVEEQHRFHFFNTFFFQKLVPMGQELSRGCGGRDAFQSVRKWTRSVNLFEKDYIFIPVNFSLHWSLIIICHPGEVANFESKNADQSSKVPCILHMDSIRGSHRVFEGVLHMDKLIRSYLWEEWKERGNEQDEEIAVKFLHLNFVSLQLPQQENWFDCGLFLLHYAELFLELVSNCSTAKYIEFLNEHWFLPAEVSLKKRYHIRKLIHKLIQDNAQKDPAAARSVLKNGGRDVCRGINLNSADDLDIAGLQCFSPILEQRNIEKSAPKECYQPRNLQEAFAEQTTVLPRDVGSSFETDEVMPPRCQLNRFLATKTCSNESVGAVAVVQDTESGDETSSMTSKDLAARVVEDSEDEIEMVSIRRRHVIPN
ncbi:probable ubiquitin-like-specific protease 2B [Salvia miltiorrhiza]|uniref:probable ubiquitin-like-specific protease 2B n=1 Tax=Salvia miltiorrhiza TaxID=226208 RepID=UPI0025ACC178|nr:probable ubiquitin-like-specific protease 2B [Salvia miltiorrhiza]